MSVLWSAATAISLALQSAAALRQQAHREFRHDPLLILWSPVGAISLALPSSAAEPHREFRQPLLMSVL